MEEFSNSSCLLLICKKKQFIYKSQSRLLLKKISTQYLTVLTICVIPTIEQEKTNSQKEA